MRRLSAAVFVLVAVIAGCGDDSTSSEPPATSSAVTTAPSPSTTVDGEGLPGERVELYPYAGAALGVVGVAADDVLDVRSGPGVGFDVVDELQPLASDLTAIGHNRLLDGDGMWVQVQVGDRTGWVSSAFVSHLGRVTDITTEIAPAPVDLPGAATMTELGRLVAVKRASQEPPSDIVVVDGPTVGDLGEITVDVIGMGDDALAGERLHVFAQPPVGEGTFTVRTVEATLLCARGVTDDGLCV